MGSAGFHDTCPAGCSPHPEAGCSLTHDPGGCAGLRTGSGRAPRQGPLHEQGEDSAQEAFFLRVLEERAATDPTLRDRPEYAALLDRDAAAIDAFGLPRIALALADLFDGVDPVAYAERVRDFMVTTTHPTLGRPWARLVYRPMLELLAELRRHGFATFIVTGGGTEFVRAVSDELYGVAPEGVVGTLIGYEYRAADATLVRTGRVHGDANEGAAKVVNIQQHLGRRPTFAAGNSAGDREMLEWTTGAPGPTLALVVDHDDAEREFGYVSVPGTFEATEEITDVARRSGWTIASMRRDWSTVFLE